MCVYPNTEQSRSLTLKSYAQMDPIFSIETRAIYEIKTTTNDVVSSEGGPIGLPSSRATEAVTVVAVVSVALLVPAGQSVHVDSLSRQTNAHVSVTAFAHYLDLEVVEATGGRYRVGGPHRAGVLVSFAVAFIVNSQV